MIIDVTTASGTQKLWKQERIILYIHAGDKVLLYTNLDGSASAPIATYTPPTSGDLYIDVTDYVRTNPSVEHIYVVDTNTSTTYDTIVDVLGLINPRSVLIPTQPSGMNMMLVSPPSRMLASLPDGRITWEARPQEGDNYTIEYYDEYHESDQVLVTTPSYTLSKQMESYANVEDEYGAHLYKCIHLQCGIRYAMVRWVSFTGATRCHTMEVVKSKIETKDAYSLLPIDNEYVEIKGREDGFTLRLNGLCAYDIWYYADMITSSKVEVSIDGITWNRVQVTKKSITMPDGEGSDGVLEIQVNWKRYDAVAM